MSTDAKQMSKTERQTLIRLVKQRFKLLETGLAARRSQLERVIRQEIIEENEAEAKAWKDRLHDEAIGPIMELIRKGDEIIAEASKAGFDRTGYGWHSLSSRVYDVRRETASFAPENLEKMVRDRMAERLGDKPMSKYALELEESRLVEELLVGELSSDDARRFLDAIPTLEGLVPLPNGGANKALMAGDD